MRTILAFALFLVACDDTTQSPSVPTISETAESLRENLIAIRRDIHRYPELSKAEARTAALVADHLRAIGAEVRSGVGGHGVIGIIRGEHPGPTIGYRADMDAVDQQEPPGRPYGSTVPGVFHICGHDLHVAIGLGVAGVLSSMRSRMHGTAVFFFQPAEETVEGARAMIGEGALAGPRPDAIYAVHVWPFPVGTVAKGAVLAGRDAFSVELDGELAKPEIVDQIKANITPIGTVRRPRTAEEVAQILVDYQTPNGPLSNFVVLNSLSSSIEGTHAVIRGSLRASSDAMYPQLRATIQEMIERVVAPGDYQLSFADAPFPSMVSDPGVSDAVTGALARAVGDQNVLSVHATWPFNGEDFALFLQEIPGAMFLVGVANPERGILGAPHFPDFDADEEAIVVGTKAMSEVIWQRLSGGG